jgi:hypothetical protein
MTDNGSTAVELVKQMTEESGSYDNNDDASSVSVLLT